MSCNCSNKEPQTGLGFGLEFGVLQFLHLFFGREGGSGR